MGLPSMTRLSEERRQAYAELVLLKLIDLAPDEGGLEFPVELPTELTPIQPLLQELRFKGLIEVSAKPRKAFAALRGKPKEEFYKLTQSGIEYLGKVIDEAEAYVSEFEDLEVQDMIAAAESRRLDPVRIRFLWGWYQGEFDDLAVFQERRNIEPVERLWAYYLTSNEFFDEVLSDLEPESN
jgi:hypothetical protein